MAVINKNGHVGHRRWLKKGHVGHRRWLKKGHVGHRRWLKKGYVGHRRWLKKGYVGHRRWLKKGYVGHRRWLKQGYVGHRRWLKKGYVSWAIAVAVSVRCESVKSPAILWGKEACTVYSIHWPQQTLNNFYSGVESQQQQQEQYQCINYGELILPENQQQQVQQHDSSFDELPQTILNDQDNHSVAAAVASVGCHAVTEPSTLSQSLQSTIHAQPTQQALHLYQSSIQLPQPPPTELAQPTQQALHLYQSSIQLPQPPPPPPTELAHVTVPPIVISTGGYVQTTGPTETDVSDDVGASLGNPEVSHRPDTQETHKASQNLQPLTTICHGDVIDQNNLNTPDETQIPSTSSQPAKRTRKRKHTNTDSSILEERSTAASAGEYHH
ncbi:ataxin-2 homolog [Engraulis encrasicolus]|uniref:ataxin-2 homolog n=1 Tax=Engraulis encrasicolus TaxID=184585 RepID=UPI002FD52297